MANAGYDILEVRFLIKPDYTECYIYCEAVGDCPISVQGWHYKVFSKETTVEEIVKIYPMQCVVWPQKSPNSKG